ncbi:MAG: N-6 DNA methylase, partial [Candidatus Omnitrophica bacterium]|nr:N-6 DNA methylase [Candidatus Omnitrophota bacterium]
MMRKQMEFETIYSEGGLLPTDLLRRIVDIKGSLPGTRPEDYGLPQGDHITESITPSWNRLRRHWSEFRASTKDLPEGESATGQTNDKWTLPLLRELGFGLLQVAAGPVIEGKTYAISRFAGATPIHLVGCGMSLDKRVEGVRGASRSSPHGLVQEFLNRSQGHLWAIVSNGLRFRILRDNQALSRQSYLEFDLEVMFESEVFSDFVLLWLMAHATRFVAQKDGRPESCWLEEWTKIADEQGTRALESLRGGVEKALQVLGQGFVGNHRNIVLREALRSGTVPLSDLHNQLLRIIYRLIFLFVAEDRTLDGASLLHPYDRSEKGRQARELYVKHYSMARMRELAENIRGSRHGDLWQQFNMLIGAFSGDENFSAMRERLSLPILGSFLWSLGSTKSLNASSATKGEGVVLSNADFLEAIRNLAFTRQGKILRHVDYKNLGAEELGGVYESLLSLTPQVSSDGARFTFAEFAGNERKTSGSYYTPDSLVQCLLDSALDPVVNEAIKGKAGAEAEKTLLNLKVCDPAVGSGHFLVGAAHRLARHLSRVCAQMEGDSEPSPVLYQKALRDVINKCLYGVDINPMSAELCKVGLWLEAMEPGKPLSFLDAHIRCGNSLIGATPKLISEGLPDAAFNPIEGDDKSVCSEAKKRNKQECQGQLTLFSNEAKPWERLGNLASAIYSLDEISDDTIEGIQRKQKKWEEIVNSTGYLNGRFLADAWCASFVWKKTKDNPPMTTADLRKIEESPYHIAPSVRADVEKISKQYQFFHWHLMFPNVFRIPKQNEKPGNEQTGWSGGFDVVLGNPPWERVKLQEKEWFAERSPDIANAPNANARKRMIDKLKTSDSSLYEQFLEDSRKAEGESHFMRNSGFYPLCGCGDINLYAVFVENMRNLIRSSGLIGCVLPSGIATDDTTKFFFQDVMDKKSLVSLYSFENEEFIFPNIHHATRFCLFTAGCGVGPIHSTAEFVFFARQVEHLQDPARRFVLSAVDMVLLNPNTRTCPIFRSSYDAELTKALYRRVPILIKDGPILFNPWNIVFLRMFDMANDSNLFCTRAQLEADGCQLKGNMFIGGANRYLPLYEAKMIHHFDHRWGTYDGQTEAQSNQGKLPELDEAMHLNAELFILPRYWISQVEVDARLKKVWERGWFLGFRDITGATVFRTAIASLLPRAATSG